MTFSSGKQVQTVTVTPDSKALQAVNVEFRDDGIAVLHLRSFANATSAEKLNAALKLANSRKVKGLILDLRRNSGGLINQALLVASNFLSDPTIYQETRHMQVKEEATQGKFRLNGHDLPAATVPQFEWYGGPLVMLVDSETASAAELLTNLLGKRGQTLILGTPTDGLGASAVQKIPLGSQATLLVTISRTLDADRQSLADQVSPQQILALDLNQLAANGTDNMVETAAHWLLLNQK